MYPGVKIDTDALDNEYYQYGLVGFDNIFMSLLTIFQVITLEGWTPIMYNLMDTNLAFLVAAFFTMMVVVGSFFLLNMILAVIMGSFTEMEELER